MSKKVFGQLYLLEPNWQLENILNWIDLGNASLLTLSDHENLLQLVQRADNPELLDRANEFLKKFLNE